jgi:acetyl/propionyl-CoA carboxylase alpha subunit
MISKLVVWGENRAQAVARMRRALDEYVVRGIETNLAFHRRCFRHPAFIEGDFDTGFIGRNTAELAPHAEDAALDAAIIAAALDAVTKSPAAAARSGGNASPSAHANGTEISGWRRSL